jgi:hypothetical protein
MTFDNSKTIISLRIRLFVSIVLLITFYILAYLAKMIKFPLLGMNETMWILFLVAVNLFIALLPMVLNYQYISYSDEGEKIVLRYFSAGIFGGRKNSVEINKNTFTGYKIETRFFGLIRSITLFAHIQAGNAKFPPVYISALTREERAKIIRSLNLFVPEK